MDIEAERLRVAKALTELEASLSDLTSALAHSGSSVILNEATEPDAMRAACEALSEIDYRTHDAAETSVVCLGVIGVSADVMQRAQRVNESKALFKALCAPLRRVMVRIPVKDQKSATRPVSAMRGILRSIQRSDLNLLAAYRNIPLLEAPPSSITYTRARTRSVYRKTVEEVYGLLNTIEGQNAIDDRASLDSLGARETHLAFVKERYQNVRANIVYSRLDARGRGRVQIAAELPILYVQGKREPPEIQFPAPATSNVPLRERESKIHATRFLKTLPVHRYL